MMENPYDHIVIGSGAGGAALADELSKGSSRDLVLERGVMEDRIGGKENSRRYVDVVKSLEGINIMRAIMAGGTTVISAGCSVRCLEEDLSKRGIDLSEEFQETEMELGVRPLSNELMSNRSKDLQKAAGRLGYAFEPMPKCYGDGCDGCGSCMTGCGRNLRWSSIDHVRSAIERGTEIVYGTNVYDIDALDDGTFRVFGMTGDNDVAFRSKSVIVCAGALETPVILQRAGIENAGRNLSVDLLRHVYGFVPGKRYGMEPPMPMMDIEFHSKYGFMLAPNVNSSVVRDYLSSQREDIGLSVENALGIMIKIRDCPNGRVFPDGTVSKDVDPSDLVKFDKASEIVRDILIEAGADSAHMFESHINGAHPAGTAAIGDVVDTNLMTGTEGLYVCDASVFPAVPGLPTIVTIVALAKRLGRYLNQRHR